MKNNKENAERWLAQSEHDINVAESVIKNGFYSDTCFMSEQASQKTLKAFLFFKGERFVTIHSVLDLARKCANFDSTFESITNIATILDQYYIPTRYPDALPYPAIPAERYTKTQADESLSYAKKILKLVKEKIISSQ